MSCLGVHFALTKEQVDALRSQPADESRLSYLQETLEEHFFNTEPEYKAETDKAWDAIHRALTDGHLSYEAGPYPFGHVILGGHVLYSGADYIMSLKTPDQVRAVASALPSVTAATLRKGYDQIDEDE